MQVAHEIVALFDNAMPITSIKLNVKNLLNHCVGVHRAYSEIYGQPEIFVRIKSDEILFKDGKKLIFKAPLHCDVKDANELTAAGYSIFIEKDNIYYVETINMLNYNPTRKDYSDLSKEIRKKGIWYFIVKFSIKLIFAIMKFRRNKCFVTIF